MSNFKEIYKGRAKYEKCWKPLKELLASGHSTIA
jgi:hypothetical protein